jgi:hypothetical protein
LETTARPTEAARDARRVIDEKSGGLTAHLESGRLRIIDTPMGQELISGLNGR